MGAQSSVNALIGSVAGAAVMGSKLGQKFSQKSSPEISNNVPAQKSSGIDMKMAAKARRMAQDKVNAIYANQELSAKARTRRLGKVMDEYTKTLGGNQ